MTEKKFKTVIGDDNYHFFVLACPAKIPFNFTKHTRIVIKDKNGDISRRDFCHFKNKKEPNLGHIHKNYLHPREGLSKYLRKSSNHFPSILLYHISGGEDSLAHKMVKFVQEDIGTYPAKKKYFLIYKNSNSFVKRVLKSNPSLKYNLPRNVIG